MDTTPQPLTERVALTATTYAAMRDYCGATGRPCDGRVVDHAVQQYLGEPNHGPRDLDAPMPEKGTVRVCLTKSTMELIRTAGWKHPNRVAERAIGWFMGQNPA